MTTRPNNPLDITPSSTPAPAPAPTQALTPDQLYEIKTADHRAHKITAAAKVAAFNGWSLAVMACLSALLTIGAIPFTGSISFFSAAVTLALGFLAFNEFKGRTGLLNFDPRAATLLGRNQIGLIIAIFIYCAVQAYYGLHPSQELQNHYDQLEQLGMSNMQGLSDMLYIAIYGSVAVASLLVQGFNAAYYFRRKKMIQLYHYHTPDWVIELKRPTQNR